MKPTILACLLTVCVIGFAHAQSPQTARLLKQLAQAQADTSRVLLMADIAASYRYSRLDSAQWYARQGSKLGRNLHYKKGEARCLTQLGFALSEKGNFAGALRELLHAQNFNKQEGDAKGWAQTLHAIGYLQLSLPDYKEARSYLTQARSQYQKIRVNDADALLTLADLGYLHRYQNQPDSAQYYQQLVLQQATALPSSAYAPWGTPCPFALRELGAIAEKVGNKPEALRYLRLSLAAAQADNNLQVYGRSCNTLATLFGQQQQLDSAIFYGRESIKVGIKSGLTIAILRNSRMMAQFFKARRQPDSSLKYNELMLIANDSLYNQERIKQLESIGFAEQINRRRIEEQQARFKSQVLIIGLAVGLTFLLLIAFILWRTNRKQKQSNGLLTQTLADLKATQAQLVQSEKLASLGELTAGIAHEIQNPLNFVNNFSEVSTELVEELEEEIDKGETHEAKAIAGDLRQNLEKITHHGKRAASIVRGMLEHARASTGERQTTDLNALAEEYLRLAYHGLRAKDKDFNCQLVTKFAPDLERVTMVPQDIGRVLLNLFNNAFYAVQQRAKSQGQGGNYEPTVWVNTRQEPGRVVICVKDNGTGMSEGVKAKVFQPFFTTKPTGEGTGLGLSLAYDIITKGHGGTLEVQSVEGEAHEGAGSEFVIELPA